MRLYITKRISKRLGTPVEGKILEPVFAPEVTLPFNVAVTQIADRFFGKSVV